MTSKAFSILLIIATLAYTPAWSETKIELKRNPFVFASPPAEHRTILQLILISNKDSTAIINGKTYKIGDTLGNYEIVSIRLDYIQITNGHTIKKVFVNESIK